MMTQLQGISLISFPQDSQAIAQKELEQYLQTQSDAIAPIRITYQFDYNQFAHLQQQAKHTLKQFLTFVHHTFDNLLHQGHTLQQLYNHTLTHCSNGKKTFHAWLNSQDFGASRYIATAAIDIYNWFSQQPPRIQRRIRENVQNWSVAALRQLTKLSSDLVKELIRTPGKKTAAQIKAVATANQQSQQPKTELNHTQTATVNLAPGVRIVVTQDESGWQGATGIIISQWEKVETPSWWVLLDNAIAQGQQTKHLFTSAQLKPETTATTSKQNHQLYTQAEVETQITAALAQRERENAEVEQARFSEIRDAALKAAAEEIKAAHQYAQAQTQKLEQLTQQLFTTEQELQRLRSLDVENQQLKQHLSEVENSLQQSQRSDWGNTFTKQAQKAINKDLATQLEMLSDAVELKDEQIHQLQTVIQQQQVQLEQPQSEPTHNEEISTPKLNQLISQLGEILGQKLGIPNWSKYGYRSCSGERYTGVSALWEFSQEVEELLPRWEF